MKKLWTSLIAGALAAALCLPALAADVPPAKVGPEDPKPPFTDVAADRWSYGAIRYCWQEGLFAGKTENTFDPAGTMNVDQALTLAARLYSALHGGSGEVPALPDLTKPFARIYDGDGKPIASVSLEKGLQMEKGDPEFSGAWNGMGEGFYLALSNKTDDPAISSPTCTMEVGYEGYGSGVKTYKGTRTFYDFQGGHMSYGLLGTGYTFEKAAGTEYVRIEGCSEVIDHYDKTAWWAPYAFYLTYHTGLRMDGGVIYRLRKAGLVTDEEINKDISGITAKFSQYAADRMMFAWLIDFVTKEQELEAVNEVTYIPDVYMEYLDLDTDGTTDASVILRLYRAGIFTGVDSAGSFGGSQSLTREQAAAILARVLDPAQRVRTGKTDRTDDPDAQLTQAEALALTLELYDRLRGGEGKLEEVPARLGYLTFKTADGMFLNGQMGETYGFSSFLPDNNADAHLYYYIPDVSEAGLAAARSWTEKPCTITVEQKHVCPGRMKLWQPDGQRWVLSFYPDKESDQFLLRGMDADKNTTPDNWRRAVNYTAWKWWDRDGVQFELAKVWHTGDVTITREAWIKALTQVAGREKVEALYKAEGGAELDPQGIPTRAEALKLAEGLAK